MCCSLSGHEGFDIGAGIAGPALAYWLLCYGHEPALVERAPTLRTGGYVVDFWGAGFDIAERMGLLPGLRRKGYFVTELRVVNRAGRRISGFSADVFARMTGGRYLSIPRGELATSIFGLIDGKVETIFGDSISGIEQTEADVRVAFEHGKPRQFDLVIGADGLHSTVRELAFGPQRRFEKYMGYKVAAFEAEGYSPRDELVYVMFTEVGQQVGHFPCATTARCSCSFLPMTSRGAWTSAMCRVRRPCCGGGLATAAGSARGFSNALDTSDELYFDRVSQIRMNPNEGLWTRGRVALVGDAAFCVSLLGGQGCALAMIAAYILAGELHRSGGDHSRAFARYQELFGPFVAGKQEAAEGFAGFFALDQGHDYFSQSDDQDDEDFLDGESGFWPGSAGQDRIA